MMYDKRYNVIFLEDSEAELEKSVYTIGVGVLAVEIRSLSAQIFSTNLNSRRYVPKHIDCTIQATFVLVVAEMMLGTILHLTQ